MGNLAYSWRVGESSNISQLSGLAFELESFFDFGSQSNFFSIGRIWRKDPGPAHQMGFWRRDNAGRSKPNSKVFSTSPRAYALRQNPAGPFKHFVEP